MEHPLHNPTVQRFPVCPIRSFTRKKQLLIGAEGIYGSTARAASADAEAREAEPFETGRPVEGGAGVAQTNCRCLHVSTKYLSSIGHPALSVRRQCEMLGRIRSSLYNEPGGEAAEDSRLMRRIDEQDTACAFYGSRQMTAWLNEQGEGVNRPSPTGRRLAFRTGDGDDPPWSGPVLGQARRG